MSAPPPERPPERPTVPRAGAVTLPARPENLPITPAETALIVVDMQNAYASPGGYLDLAGFDIEGSAAVIDRIALAIEAARRAGGQGVVFQPGGVRHRGLGGGNRPHRAGHRGGAAGGRASGFLQNGWDADYAEAGGPGS